MMSSSWILSCQIIGIPKETKQEIVTTLISYPLVLSELETSKMLVDSQQNTIDFLKESIEIKQAQLNLREEEISNLETQKNLFKKQLRKERLKIGSIGLAAIITVILIK